MEIKRGIIFLGLFGLFVLLSMQFVAADTKISDDRVSSVIIKEISNSAFFEVTVDNDNSFADTFTIGTLLDIEMLPKSLGFLTSYEKKTFDVEVVPSLDFRERVSGNFAFEYYVKGDNADIVKNTMIVNVVPFSKVLEIVLPVAVEADEETIELGFKLNEDIEFDAAVSVESELINQEFDLTLSKDDREINLALTSDLSDKAAGVYEAVFTFTIGGNNVSVVKDLILGSVVDVATEEVKTGRFLSRGVTVTKTNNGNSVTEVVISLKKGVLASLFTSFSGSPMTRKEGGSYIYEWKEELNPGESLTADMKTNYWLPFIILLLLIAAVIVFKIVTAPDVRITKKAVRVRTKSGMFASKIIVNIKNTGRPISNVKVIEGLPAFTEVLRDKFGAVTPSEIKKRTVIWDFAKLSPGEELMFSYVIYSKVNVFGKLEVPASVVTYRDEKDNFKESMSNKIYLLVEEEKRVEVY